MNITTCLKKVNTALIFFSMINFVFFPSSLVGVISLVPLEVCSLKFEMKWYSLKNLTLLDGEVDDHLFVILSSLRDTQFNKLTENRSHQTIFLYSYENMLKIILELLKVDKADFILAYLYSVLVQFYFILFCRSLSIQCHLSHMTLTFITLKICIYNSKY